MLGGVAGDRAEIGGYALGKKIGADEVRRTVSGTLFIYSVTNSIAWARRFASFFMTVKMTEFCLMGLSQVSKQERVYRS